MNPVLDFVFQHSLPIAYAFYAERIIRKRLKEVSRENANFSGDQATLDEFGGQLEKYVLQQEERRKAIDDKAKSCLLVITVTTTVMLAGLNLVTADKTSFRWPLLFLLVLGTTCFVFAAITSVKALDVVGFGMPHPRDWITSPEGADTISVVKPDTVALLFDIIRLNDYELNIRANFVSATLFGLRNGIIVLALAFVIGIFNLGNQIQHPSAEATPSKASAPSNTPSPNGALEQPLVSPEVNTLSKPTPGRSPAPEERAKKNSG